MNSRIIRIGIGALLIPALAHSADTTRDIVIYGSSPAAISAAVQAKRMGASVVVVSPETRIGGLTTGGLGQTDIGNKSAFGGIALEFYRDVAKWYADPAHWTRQTAAEYRPGGQTAGTMGADSMWTFEPSAALAILEGWEKRDKLDIRRGELLEKVIKKKSQRIAAIKTISGNYYLGKVFIDATYEGDLMAAAGVSYTVGREANSVYGETISGVQFREAKSHQLKWYVSPYVVEGKPESGLLPGIEPYNPDEKDGDGDKRVQAYNFRMCLTDDPDNRIPFKKPANYDEKEYELLFRNFAKGETSIPWINSKMPNRKTDTNNRLGFSTDFIGRNYEWPEASYARRAEIFKAHLDYQQGLMWTLANHPRIPEKIRAEVSRWGTCKDEFLDGPGDGWQSQLYVREARRMVGEYVMTEHECRGDRVAPRPVAMGAYTMDSHNVRRVVTAKGNTQNEGDVEDNRRYSAWGPDAAKRAKGGGMKPYGIDYGAIVPKRGECANLLVPVCLSASHMAFGSIRMEPVFFALGQAAGTAASMAVANGASVQDVPYAELRGRLLADGCVIALGQNAAKKSEPHLYMAGDSIMAEYKNDMFPQYGWGQAMKAFMKDPSRLHNLARSGWSARRFRESGRWEDGIASKLKPGDWVIVSFGHNDMNKRRNKPPKNDYSTPAEYKAFLAGFVADAKAKGANIAFATSIAHSAGFSETNGVMLVNGGATGLGTYVAAMREAAAELGVPLLDLNRYAEENLPKMGLEAAKSLYMTVKPGEYPNYPDGKNDPAHIRESGAYFYARAAVELARSQGISLSGLLKDPASVTSAQAGTFRAVSPDGLNEVRLDVGANGMAYSVWRNGKAVVLPTDISLHFKEKGSLNGAGAKPKATSRKVGGTLSTPRYKKSSVDLSANETRVDFGEWALVLHARNDGVAWRFETKFDGEVTVTAENTNVRFPKGAELCYTQEGGFQSGWEKPALIGPVESVKPGHPQIVMTPFTATVPGAGVVTVTESNLLDYPGLNFHRRDGEPDMLRSWQAGVPDVVERGRRMTNVKSRKPYLAQTKGTRVYPWRVFVLGASPSDLVSADAVYALAEPSRIADASWVKPGQVAWDWWNGFKITDVPGLKTGCNFETYKEYVNFAAANGIAYIIMDEGWSEKLDLDRPRDEVAVPGVIAYAKEKGVGVILWAAWSPLIDRADRLRIFDRYAAMGAKGFKIDFMNRDDQQLERFLEETAGDAAERKLVVMYHGIHKPTGLQRTYPNILNYEGVYGLEQGHSIGGRKVVVSNDVNLVYTRMVAGFMDYTPGAMRNRAFDAPPFDKAKDAPACYGTRCHQLALFPLFEAPVQMLCDSPTQYRTAPECTAFLTKVPTVWDETRGVAGEIGKFASVARRKGGEWWLGAITNWEAREVELPTDFLGGGEWLVEAFEDAPDAGTNAEHYVRRESKVKAGERLKVRLASGGGFAARFTPLAPAR